MPIKFYFSNFDKERAQKAIDYLHKHYTDKISPEQLAIEAGMGKKLLQQTFVFLTGMTIHRYHVKYRVERTIPDIEDDRLTLDQIAIRHGFGSLTVYGRLFRMRYGMSPKKYRRGALV